MLRGIMNAFAELEQLLNPAEPIFMVEGAWRLVDMPPIPSVSPAWRSWKRRLAKTQNSAERSEHEVLIHSSKLLSVLRLKGGVLSSKN